MREDEKNWFSRWEEELPSYEELMPLSQSLITPDLAMAFDIRNPDNTNNNNSSAAIQPPPIVSHSSQGVNITAPITPPLPGSATHPPSAEFDNSPDLGSGAAGDEPARTLKRPRLVWTPQLHKRFVDAVAHLGIKNAVPKTIMQLMSVDGLTRENVASHLQKYRLYLKRMQGISSGGGGHGSGGLVASDPATDHLFASSPVPAHFLHPGRSSSDHYMPFVQSPPTGGPIWMAHPPLQQQFHQPRQVGHFGSPPNGGQFELPFMARQSQPPHRIGPPMHNLPPAGYVEDSGNGIGGGRKVLTLFPTGDD